MRNVLLAFGGCAALAAASAATAQPGPAPAPGVHQDDLVRAVPSPGEMRDIAVGLDRVVGALLNIDIAPVVEAVDPAAPALRRGERTLRDIGSRGDPYFEDRLRSNIYGVSGALTEAMGRMAVLVPVLQRTIEVVEQDVAEAMRQPVPPPPPRPYD